MREVIVAFSILIGVIPAVAQTALTPSGPALGVPSGSLSPGSPVLGGRLPALATFPASATNGLVLTNVTIDDLAAAVQNLQFAIEQSLPVVAAFNGNFDLASTGGVFSVSPLVNFSQNTGRNTAMNFARGFGQLAGVNNAANQGLPQPPPVPAVVPAPALAPPVPAFAVPGQTNGIAASGLTENSLRALVILQSDMERLLPVISALNGVTNAALVFGDAGLGGSDSE